MALADITPLLGRHFTTSSGNTIRTIKLADGALRLTYSSKPSAQDIEEAEAWVSASLEGFWVTRRNVGLATEKEALKAWQKEMSTAGNE